MKLRMTIVLSTVILSMLILPSCSLLPEGWPRALMLSWDSIMGKHKIVETSFDEIAEYIQNSDKEAFKAMFAQNIVKESEDFDKSIDAAFEILYDHIDIYRKQGEHSGKISRYGQIREIYTGSFYIGKNDNYYISFILCIRDDFDADNIGLAFFKITTVINKDEQIFSHPLVKIGEWKTVDQF